MGGGRLPAEAGDGAQDDGCRDRPADDFGDSDGPRDRPEGGACWGDFDVSNGIRPDASAASGARSFRAGPATAAKAPADARDRDHGDAVPRDRVAEDGLGAGLAADLPDETVEES